MSNNNGLSYLQDYYNQIKVKVIAPVIKVESDTAITYTYPSGEIDGYRFRNGKSMVLKEDVSKFIAKGFSVELEEEGKELV